LNVRKGIQPAAETYTDILRVTFRGYSLIHGEAEWVEKAESTIH